MGYKIPKTRHCPLCFEQEGFVVTFKTVETVHVFEDGGIGEHDDNGGAEIQSITCAACHVELSVIPSVYKWVKTLFLLN